MAKTARPATRGPRSAAGLIPAFALYGETGEAPEALHVEPIQSRSPLYRWEIDAHVHDGLHQVLWVAGGRVRIRLDDLDETGAGPLAVIIPPGVVHAFRFDPDTHGEVLTFNARALIEGDAAGTGAVLSDLFSAPALLRFEPGAAAAARLSELFASLLREFAADTPLSPVPLWLARAVLWRLAQHSERLRSASARSDLVTRFLVLVEAHHRDHWPVTRYAAALGVSPERLNRLVRAETGEAALDLVHARLALEARRRLTYIAAPVSRLAFELGFQDPAYFCRFFKRHTGQSPREFRRFATR